MILAVLSILIPLFAGVLIYGLKVKNKALLVTFAITPIVLSLILNIIMAFNGIGTNLNVLKITQDICIYLQADAVSMFFCILISVIFLLVGIFSLSYFEKDEHKNAFDCFYLLSFAALMALCYAGNLITMYATFELVTLCSMPMVLHEKTKESIDAAMKYLIYSISGAFLGLLGVIFVTLNCSSTVFVFGGSLNDTLAHPVAFQIMVLLMLVGFGAKCGMFPLHNWLPAAHPVAPAPASAVLSGIITKSGIIAIIRIVYFTIGTKAIQGTWVQYVWVILIMITILLGSFMAVLQKNFKKRLAFSSVSQISYVLLGVSMLNEEALQGAFMHVASHAIIKVALFLTAGVLIHVLNIHNVDEMDGVGKKMPVTMWCYTICSLGLIGVPPTTGFVSKWYIANGALSSGLGVLGILAPVVLIISAILTAGYLLTITIHAFFPKNKDIPYERVHEPLCMVIPLVILATLTLVVGIFASPILNLVGGLF